MYEVEFSKLADRQLSRLPEEFQKRIVKVLERVSIRPHRFVKRLVGSKYFSLRVGEYRVILDIIDNNLLIFVVELGHRRRVYKKR